jgi:hypothetical protein
VQVILIGDLFQLPPIVRERDLKEYFTSRYGGTYFFRAHVFRDSRFHLIELQKVYRQTDATFLHLLNSIRDRRLDNGVLETLNRRVRDFETLVEGPEKFVTLTPTNQAAFNINMSFLKRLPNLEHTFEAIVSGKFDPASFPTDSTLRLKLGAHVMMLRNDPDKRWLGGFVFPAGWSPFLPHASMVRPVRSVPVHSDRDTALRPDGAGRMLSCGYSFAART